MPTELNGVGGARVAQLPGTRLPRPDFTTGVMAQSGAQKEATEASLAQSPGAWHLNALRTPLVKSGCANPVPGTYAPLAPHTPFSSVGTCESPFSSP